MRRPLRTFVIVLCVVALVAGTPAVATAAEVRTASVRTADDGFIPSPNKWRAFLVNVLSSVLSAVAPGDVKDIWRREQIANIYRYDGGFETLNAKFGINGIRTNEAGQITGVRYSNIGTGTYDDVVIAGLEDQYKKKGTLRPPATKILGAVKIVGGVASVAFAYEMGAFLGSSATNGVGGMFGFDANGAVCAAADRENSDIEGWILTTLSGQDCSAWQLGADYDPNADIGPGSPVFTVQGTTLTLVGKTFSAYSPGRVSWCYQGLTPYLTTTGHQYATKLANGTWKTYGRVLGGMPAGHPGAPAGTGGGCSGTNGGPAQAGRSGADWGSGPPSDAVMGSGVLYVINTTGGNAIVAQQEASPTPDPDRQQKCEVTYTDGSKLSLLGDIYKESSGAVAPAECPDTPAGKTPDRVTVTDTGQPPGAPPLYDEPVTDEYQEWWEDYPECRSGACKLDLIKKNRTPALSCFDIEEGCPGWFEDPSKLDNYLCRYGVHDVALEECNVYSGVFQPGRVTTGSPYSDPKTGVWSGGQNAPRSADQAMTRTIQNPAAVRGCNFPNVFLDPIGAAIAGAQCLIEWAAIPRPLVAEVAFVGVQDVWAEKPPGAIAATVTNLNLSGSPSGCSITTTYKGTTAPLLDACGGYMAMFATFSRLASVALMGVLVFNQLRRQIGAMVNYNQGQG